MHNDMTLSFIQLLGGASVVLVFLFILYTIMLFSLVLKYHDAGYTVSEAFKKAKEGLK